MSIYTKQEILDRLNGQILEISSFIGDVEASIINERVNGKWSIAENAEHLIRSVQPLTISLSLPKFAFFPFGKKPSKSYEEIIGAYEAKLSEGAKASLPYTPKATFRKDNPTRIADKWKKAHESFSKKITSWSDDDLDRYCIPHPIIGNITVRNMLMWTTFHIGYHFETMKRLQKNLSSQDR